MMGEAKVLGTFPECGPTFWRCPLPWDFTLQKVASYEWWFLVNATLMWTLVERPA